MKIEYATTRYERRQSKARHDLLRALGRCINGPVEDRPGKRGVVHGPVVSGGRCQRCIDVKKGIAPSQSTTEAA